MSVSSTLRRARVGLAPALVALLALTAPWAQAQFAAAITPPRFELDTPAGQVTRQVIEIMNSSPQEAQYRVYTADWSLNAEGQISFLDELQPGSCRPWVAIERKQIAVKAGTRMRYRFEIRPPEGTPPTECRFAVMIESGQEQIASGPVRMPMSGRIGVIVYARTGGVQPDLQIKDYRVLKVDGRFVPALQVRNDGTATGRFSGFITARTADGRVVDLSPNSVPLLPGMTRTVELFPAPPLDKPDAPPPELKWPVKVSGQLEVENSRQPATPLDRRFELPGS